MSIVVGALLAGALAEIRSARAGDVVGPDDQALALQFFNELLDALNANDRAVYTTAFPTFVITPSLQPHTIGVVANAPTWPVTIARPARIKAANVLISSSVRIPIDVRHDEAWWMAQRTRAVTAAYPTDGFYSPDWPNGSLYLWPIPLTAYMVELNLETLLAQVADTDTLDLPPGYQEALRLTLAEKCAPSFGQEVSARTERMAREARERIWGDNAVIPNLETRDAGMPGVRGGGFNFLTGQIS